MIPSQDEASTVILTVYQRGVVIDSQHNAVNYLEDLSISKGSGD